MLSDPSLRITGKGKQRGQAGAKKVARHIQALGYERPRLGNQIPDFSCGRKRSGRELPLVFVCIWCMGSDSFSIVSHWLGWVVAGEKYGVRTSRSNHCVRLRASDRSGACHLRKTTHFVFLWVGAGTGVESRTSGRAIRSSGDFSRGGSRLFSLSACFLAFRGNWMGIGKASFLNSGDKS